MSKNNFDREIATVVSEWDMAGKELVPAFITNEIIQKHVAGGLARANEHTDFFMHYAYKGHRKDVGTYIAKNFGDGADADRKAEELLPGFEHIQRRYVIKRGEEMIGVLTEQMSDEEIEAQAQMLRRRGRSCFAHADELDRYKALRAASKVA